MTSPDTPSSRARVFLQRRWPLLAAGAGVLALGGVGLAVMPREEPAQVRAEPRVQPVTVVEVAMRPFVRTAPVSGDIRPVRDIQVFAPVQGVRIADVLVDEGDWVQAGQPLARLETNVAEAQTSAAEAQVAEAEVEQVRTKAEYERALAIASSGALSQEAIESRRAAAGAAEARLKAARAALSELNARLQGGFVRAPAAGLVINRQAVIGAYADQQALFRIAGDNRLEVAAEVAESDVVGLQKGMPATFDLGEGRTVEAKLRRPPAAVSGQTRTGQALFDLPRDPRLRTGMFLRGEVILGEHPDLAVPATAVAYDADGSAHVFQVVDGRARRAPVVLGARNGDFVAVLSGLQAGDLVAAAGGAFLQDGDRVQPTRAMTPPAIAAASAKPG